VAIIAAAVLANQFSVGLSNDWIDAPRDRAVGRTDKPVASGEVSARLARNLAFVLAAASVALTIPLGWRAAAAHLVFLASGWAYNAWLKSTVFSVVPYMTGFGVIPAIVTLGAAVPRLPEPWTLAVAAVLGVAAHFANVLPDLDDDRATGVFGLPQHLGRVTVGVVGYLALATATVISFLGVGGLDHAVGPIGLGANTVLCALGLTLARSATRWHFRFIIIASIVLVAMLAVGGF
jgi:4-hydroxybenzoate polyprenyltransferase